MTQQQFWQIATENRWDLAQMRFFIGELHREPCCFGVYQDGADWVVYKMKSDGSYVEHFRGEEEAAFQIIYDKIHSEIQNRRAAGKLHGNGTGPKPPRRADTRPGSKFKIMVPLLAALVIIIAVFVGVRHYQNTHRDGYYVVNGVTYYETHGDWYYFDDYYDDWYYYDSPEDDWYYEGDYSPYYYGDYGYAWDNSTWADDYTYYDTDTDTGWYDDTDTGGWENDDWGSDDWDTGDWDAGDTDWDSDW